MRTSSSFFIPWILGSILVLLAACAGGPTGTTPPTTVPTTTTLSTTTTTTAATTTTAPTTSTTTVVTSTTAPDATVVSITVSGDRVDGPGRVRVKLGEEVRLEVVADRSDEVHVHGYDLYADVAPDSPAVIVFTADVPGIFEVELESAHLPLVELEVAP